MFFQEALKNYVLTWSTDPKCFWVSRACFFSFLFICLIFSRTALQRDSPAAPRRCDRPEQPLPLQLLLCLLIGAIKMFTKSRMQDMTGHGNSEQEKL